jgi:putative ABC transport system permease protein
LGLVPQLQFKTTSLLPALQSEPGRATSSRDISRYRSIFVVCQVAVSLILLIGAALFLQSLQHAEFMDPGFHPEKAMAVDLDLKLSRLNEEQGREFYKNLVERVSHLPGVESTAFGDLAPLDIATARTAILLDGYQSAPGQPVFQISSNYISAGYFKTLAIPLVSGSDFTVANHKNSQLVAIINETMANRFWHGQTSLGKTFRLAGNNKLVTVNGVARNVKYRTLGEEPEPHLYLSVEQDYQSSLSLFVRTSSDPARFIETIQKEIRNIRPGIQGFFARTLEQHTSFAMLPARIAAWLSGIFAIIALILSVTGIYGTVGYSIAIQTKEIGIRIALGAEPSQILKWLILRGMILAGIGLVSGMLLALAGTKILAKFLFRISPTDLPTFVVVLLVLAFATLVACYLPARRALRIDPAKAMRDA